MSSIDSLGAVQSTNQTSGQASPDKLGQNEFLKLMTTQLTHQDPFKPMDNGEFLGQMAQFGTVNGITELQNSFTTFAAAMQSNQALQAASLVGHEVLVESDQGFLPDSGSLKGAIELPNSAENVVVNILSGSGAVVQRIDLGAQNQGLVQFEWDGSRLDGGQAPSGSYRLEVLGTKGGYTESLPVMVQSRVDSLTLGKAGEGLKVDLQNIGQMDFSEIKKIL